jgi:hypothetical protein
VGKSILRISSICSHGSFFADTFSPCKGCQHNAAAQLSEDEKRLAIRNELAANLFRATQTEEKLRRDQVHGKRQANQAHYEVGRKVRKTIIELGGTMPENLPTPKTSIAQIEAAQKKLGKKKSAE